MLTISRSVSQRSDSRYLMTFFCLCFDNLKIHKRSVRTVLGV